LLDSVEIYSAMTVTMNQDALIKRRWPGGPPQTVQTHGKDAAGISLSMLHDRVKVPAFNPAAPSKGR